MLKWIAIAAAVLGAIFAAWYFLAGGGPLNQILGGVGNLIDGFIT